MNTISKGNLTGISSKGGYWKDGVFYPTPVSAIDPLHILYGYPVVSNGISTAEAGTKSSMSYEDDGHGVITSRVTYYSANPVNIVQGSTHPKISGLKCLRSSVSQNGTIYETTAEYIGLENGRTESKLVLTGDFGYGTAPIKLNKNFSKLSAVEANGWNPKTLTFEAKEDKGKIVDPNNLYGTKSFFTPTTTLSGFFFTTQSATLQSMIRSVGRIANNINFGGADAAFYNSLPKSSETNKSNHYFISGVSHESLAHLYKIKFSVIYSSDGYNQLLYDIAN